jgi:hypothetical protein
MSSIQTKISIHNSDGWKGQYERMKRWDKRLEKFNCFIVDTEHLHDFLDTLYTTYQNIFHLKDWLYKDEVLDRHTLNNFVNTHKEIGICRDIANGTKHFTLDNNFSIDNNFLIMSAYDPSNNDKYWRDSKIRIISKAGLFDPFALSKKCIAIWTLFLRESQVLTSETEITVDDLLIDLEYYEKNIQTVFGQRVWRKKNSH